MKARSFRSVKRSCRLSTVFSLFFLTRSALLVAAATNEMPTDWIASATGHRIIRLSSRSGSSSLYFHQNSYTSEGDKLVFDMPEGIGAVDLGALGAKPPKVDIVVTNGRALAMARRTREVYFSRRGELSLRTLIRMQSARFAKDSSRQSIVTRRS